jgi:pSer/pThr/pTyr-binding forkhead associated (FHA) protein
LPEDQPPSLLESRPAPDLASDRPIIGSLHFSTGQIVPLDRPVIVGRAPSVDPVIRADQPRVVQIDNLDQDISRNHVEVWFDGRDVLVVDLNSANGTIVAIPGQMPQLLIPQEPFALVGGSVVTLSEEAFFSYEVSS